MKRIVLAIILGSSMIGSAALAVPVAGEQKLGVTVAEMKAIVLGWSARNDILGQPVYNEKGEKLGTVDDVIVTPARSVSFAVIGTGGFVGLAKHDVAIPVDQMKLEEKKLILPGATKDALKALPEFQYAQR
jgi:sporulation protein YlmC with PRC-barrel domain